MKSFRFAKLLPIFLLFVFSCRGKESALISANQLDAHKTQLQEGDIIFQTSLSSQSKAIQLATHSKWSHMGIVFKQNENWYVFEASNVVKATKLNDWIERGEGGHYVIKRVIDDSKIKSADNLAAMKKCANKFLGKKYDLYFEWSDDKIYCSELVWKVYDAGLHIQVGQLQHLKDFDLSNAAVQQKMKERFGTKIPYNETVISPQAMFESDLLKQIDEH